MSSRFAVGLLVWVLLPSAAVWAQSPVFVDLEAMEPGSRVRVWPYCDTIAAQAHACEAVVGRLVASPGDSLVLEDDRGVTRQVELVAGTRVERSIGRKGHTVSGALIGTLVGFGTGALMTSSCKSEHGGDPMCGLSYVVSVPSGMLLGTLIGAISRSERWEPVWISAVALHVMPLPGHANVGVTIPF
jgi:hypothetical protein